MGFVVGYAPCGLSPQIDGMPVILQIDPAFITRGLSYVLISLLLGILLLSYGETIAYYVIHSHHKHI